MYYEQDFLLCVSIINPSKSRNIFFDDTQVANYNPHSKKTRFSRIPSKNHPVSLRFYIKSNQRKKEIGIETGTGEHKNGTSIPKYKFRSSIVKNQRNQHRMDFSGLKLSNFIILCQNSTFLNLKNLNLSSNKLKCIPGSIFWLQNLKKLDLSKNNISSEALSRSLGKFRHLLFLEELNLSKNLLYWIPQAMGNTSYFQSLRYLDLSFNNLEFIPIELSTYEAVSVNGCPFVIPLDTTREKNSTYSKYDSFSFTEMGRSLTRIGNKIFPSQLTSYHIFKTFNVQNQNTYFSNRDEAKLAGLRLNKNTTFVKSNSKKVQSLFTLASSIVVNNIFFANFNNTFPCMHRLGNCNCKNQLSDLSNYDNNLQNFNKAKLAKDCFFDNTLSDSIEFKLSQFSCRPPNNIFQSNIRPSSLDTSLFPIPKDHRDIHMGSLWSLMYFGKIHTSEFDYPRLIIKFPNGIEEKELEPFSFPNNSILNPDTSCFLNIDAGRLLNFVFLKNSLGKEVCYSINGRAQILPQYWPSKVVDLLDSPYSYQFCIFCKRICVSNDYDFFILSNLYLFHCACCSLQCQNTLLATSL
ncbi:hypothetical protein BB560_001767 [Smittium megazygosporum]|uniref:Uncharacterized protein n=1 Tax=Smittium megazygosporum TaxID=133381 RepID=A0A2T9ZGM5_9FUNG|nr:hypothetical protein BB560_001767 [Smittium megazygosporum]